MSNDKNNKYIVNPYINDFNDFKKSLGIEETNNIIDNFEYIRYINEINGDSFYRSFIFNYIEFNLINQNDKKISMLIIDIFKIYDLKESIFLSSNIKIKNVLICFSIIYDFIKINMWDMAYKFFIYSYNNELDEVLTIYLKYNIFLYLSKINFIINSENKNNNKNKKHHHRDECDSTEEYKFEYISHLIKYNEPTKIIFQCITYIFGISLNILYYNKEKYDNNNNSNLNISTFKNPYNEGENNNKIINLLFCYDNYHILYQKSYINSNGNDTDKKRLLKIFIDNLNKLSLISKNINSLSKNIHCNITHENSNLLEIKIESSNKSESASICSHCLYSQIEEHLKRRVSTLHQEKFKNYLYYLKPISLQIYSEKEKNKLINITLTNYDYIHLYKETFNEKINELMKDICIICSKKGNLYKLECGCEFCFNCIKLLIYETTKGKIILNNYEKSKLQKKIFKCPLCHKNLDYNNFIVIFKQNENILEYDYNDAKQRMKKICIKKCLSCSKKINKIGLDIKVKSHFKIKVKIFIDDENNFVNNNNQKLEEGFDYCEDVHSICCNCYKILNKNNKVEKKDGNTYKKLFCNICNIEHYIDINEWNSFKKSNICCKCNIF